MAGAIRSSRGPIAEINVTPLVDVVLVLLIIFMVITNMEDPQVADGIPIELPGAATAQSVADREPFTVAVSAEGRMVLRGEPATPDAVVAAVRAELAVRGDSFEVVVSADRRARHERFVALLDLLRAEGVSRFAIQTDGDISG
ncbi:MAG: biopolymer transport protein ExbD [Myxococcota bacterium]|jgi:biopolymer transport protein ExbD